MTASGGQETADVLRQAIAALGEGRIDEALSLLLPHADSSQELRIHAAITALHGDRFGVALELLRKALAAPPLAVGADRLDSVAALSLLAARALIGSASLQELVDVSKLGELEGYLAAARKEPLLAPPADLLGMHIDLLKGRISATLAASIEQIERTSRSKPGNAREHEAFELMALSLKQNFNSRFHHTKAMVRFIGNRAAWDAEVEARRRSGNTSRWTMNPRIHAATLFDTMIYAGMGLSMLLGMRARGYFGGVKTSRKRRCPVHVPAPAPDGKDWEAVLRTYAHYVVVTWQTPNAELETFLLASTKCEDSLNLYRLVREEKPRMVLQVGTFVGFSAAVIGQALRDAGVNDATIHLVDPNLEAAHFLAPFDTAKAVLGSFTPAIPNLFHFHEGWFASRSHAFAARTEEDMPTAWRPRIIGNALLESLEGPLDFAFVDGDHSIVGMLADSLAVIDYLREGGVALYHDSSSLQGVRFGLQLLQADGEYFDGGEERGLASRADVVELWPNNFDGMTFLRMRRPIYRRGPR